MVITDNNFRVIVEAVKSGRIITDNIRKILYYLLSTSLQQICLISFAFFTFLPLPLSAVQILWINLVTDGVQDKFFAFLKEEGDVMRLRPKKPSKKFIDQTQVIRVLFFAFGVGVLLFSLYFLLRTRYPQELTSSIVFTSCVVAQWANGFQAQKEREPFFKNVRRSFSINPLIFVGVAIGVVLQLSVVYIFPKAFKIVPLSLFDWIFPIGTFFVVFALVELRKWVEYWWTSGRPENK
jgi:P-type Ca2+ transporter type 2C